MTGLRLGTTFGIGVFVHWSFVLLPSWVAFHTFHTQDGGLPGVLFSLLLVGAVFVCVVLHELGHSLVARRVGVPTHSITLYPIGGIARLAFMPRNPRHELGIAIAGPAVNLAIAGALFPLVLLLGLPGLEEGAALAYDLPTFVTTLLFYNLVMIVFNLIPAFPMDGGRVLRALIAWRGRYGLATQIAARLGQLLALLFFAAGLGLFGSFPATPTLVIIGVFIFLAAEAERRQALRPPPPPPYLRPLHRPLHVEPLVFAPEKREPRSE